MAVPPDAVLDRAGEVVFGLEPWGRMEGWATNFTFSAGVRADVEGEVVGSPTVECSTGSASVFGEWARGIAEREPGETWVRDDAPRVADRVFRLQFDPRPPDGNGRLAGGEHTCTVRFTIRKGTAERTVEGSVRVFVGQDGTVEIGPPSPSPPEEAVPGATGEPPAVRREDALPLPYRYAVDVRCLNDDGETLLLERWPRRPCQLGRPTYRWSASAADRGAGRLRAGFWRRPGTASRRRSLCRRRPSDDLQLGTYRRG